MQFLEIKIKYSRKRKYHSGNIKIDSITYRLKTGIDSSSIFFFPHQHIITFLKRKKKHYHILAKTLHQRLSAQFVSSLVSQYIHLEPNIHGSKVIANETHSKLIKASLHMELFLINSIWGHSDERSASFHFS